MYPTVMSLVGLPIHAGVQGKDLSPMLTGGEEFGYDRVACELDLLPDNQYGPAHAIRSHQWKLNSIWKTIRMRRATCSSSPAARRSVRSCCGI